MRPEEHQRLAETEDNHWYFQALNSRMLLDLGPLRGRAARVLDVGCGTGGLIRHLQRTCPEWMISGCDLSPVACELTQQRTGVPVLEGSVTDLPFSDASFDIVLCADVLSQIDNVRPALQELARVASPGGMVVIHDSAHRWLWSFHDEAVGSRQRFRRRDLARAMQAAGLTLHRSSYSQAFLLVPMVIRRKLLPPPSDGGSDVRPSHPLVDGSFAALAALERKAMAAGLSLPTGTSVFISAKRPAG